MWPGYEAGVNWYCPGEEKAAILNPVKVLRHGIPGYDEEMAGYMRPFFEQDGGSMLRNEIMTDLIHGRLMAIFAGEAPELTAEEADADSVEEEAEAEAGEAAAEESEATEEAESAESEPNNEEQN